MGKKLLACLAACSLALSPSFAAPKGAAASSSTSASTSYNFWPIIATIVCVGLGVAALVSLSNTQGTHSHS